MSQDHHMMNAFSSKKNTHLILKSLLYRLFLHFQVVSHLVRCQRCVCIPDLLPPRVHKLLAFFCTIQLLSTLMFTIYLVRDNSTASWDNTAINALVVTSLFEKFPSIQGFMDNAIRTRDVPAHLWA